MDTEKRAISRRKFVRDISLLTAGGSLLAGSGAVEAARAAAKKKTPDKWPMRLSTSTIQYTKLPIEDACKRIADLGFEGVDIWSRHAGCPHLDDVAKRLGGDGLKALLKKCNLKLYSFSVYSGGYPRYAKLLGDAGGGVAVRGSGRGKGSGLTARMKNCIESLKPQVELAEKYNSYLAIENHGGALLNSLDSFKAFVDINKSERLGIALAPYHLQRIKASIPEAIRICGKQLLFFYAWQASKGTGQLPGIGPVDCVPWLKALQDIKYKWYVNPFMHHQPAPDEMTAALKKSVAYLKKSYDKIQ
ncbi:MAG: sugar phosphate isomerase/epimerase [Phycisphaerae bacterium]|jgi:sugar phosphate isomerase/epimerase|nr:sugar phosphate isomerase/epimerase [Phycisphaerae bacterium]